MLDTLVIGSGYAGSAIAARLAPHGRVLVVERGRRWRPGDFPRGVVGLGRAYLTAHQPDGLWAMRLGAGTGVAFASAVGGSSAVNYGITARPDDHVFDDWPVTAAQLDPYFARARDVLRPSASPRADRLGDKAFLDLVEPGRRVDLENTIDWERCDDCGQCVPGCNRGAKRTLEDSYLALALAAGAELRPGTEAIDHVALPDGRHLVALRPTGGGAGGCEWVTARHVVLAAGTLGTLDLLHRWRLPVGPRFGERIGLNGDGLAFLYDTPHALTSHSGAPISTSVRLPFVDAAGRSRTLTVMSGRVPAAALRFTAAALALAAGRLADGDAPGGAATPGSAIRRLRDLVVVDGGGALSRSFMFKLDAEDSSAGRARFTRAGAVIDWPDYADDPILRFAEARLRDWAARTGGRVIKSVARLTGGRGFSVHPLGGCRMGRSIDDGVVDDVGRVFDPRGGVHPGLRVADGSVVPGSIGVPPSWTIAAVAERIADDLIAEQRRARA